MQLLINRLSHYAEVLAAIKTKPEVHEFYYAYKKAGSATGWGYLATGFGPSDIKQSVDALKTAKTALEFYADPSKYPAPLTGGMGALWSDCGKIARDALGGKAPTETPLDAIRIAQKASEAWLAKRDITLNRKEARDYETMAIAAAHIVDALKVAAMAPPEPDGRIEAAYRLGHLRGCCGGTVPTQDEDWEADRAKLDERQ